MRKPFCRTEKALKALERKHWKERHCMHGRHGEIIALALYFDNELCLENTGEPLSIFFLRKSRTTTYFRNVCPQK
jgi:hypothetical protein